MAYGLESIAVAHDVIFVLGIYSLCYKFMPFGMEIDQAFYCGDPNSYIDTDE
jgi:SecD/SecF fusion protein